MRVNIEKLIDTVNEMNDATRDWYASNAAYHRAHPFRTVWLDRPANDDEKHIVWAAHQTDTMRTVFWTLCETLNLTVAEHKRLCSAARALRKWYEKTQWERCPDHDMLKSLENFIFGRC